MKKRVGLIVGLGLLSSLLIFTQTYATHQDAFTFFVPYPAVDLADFFRAGGQQPGGFTVTGVENIISISVLRDGSVIYYDQWEDGLERNLFVPIQPSTQVWGDGDTSNGVAPTVRQPNAGDLLLAGDVIALRNVVPVVPRDPANLFFDGGDKISSAGGAIAVTLAAWPQPDGGILFAGAWELYPTSRWDPNYVIPVGQNVPRPQGGFNIVGLSVQAGDDGTRVQIVNGDGTPIADVVRNQGERYTVVSGVLAGAEVHASAPVQVHIFTKDPASRFEARAYTMLPFDQWGNNYLAPRSSDGDYWLYNPDSADLQVLVQTEVGSETITIPGNRAGRYPLLPAPVLASGTGAHFTSIDRRPFYGIAALDANQDQDWGYALLPIGNLTTQALVGWAPGNWPPPPGPGNGGTGFESRVYVTALVTTTIYVDYGDGRTVPIDVFPLQERDITDPVDFDMTGARLYTTDGQPFIAVWGQDESASLALPSMDLGTNIVPLRAPSIQKTYALVEEGYNCGTVTRGNRVRFQLQAFNDSSVPIPDAIVADILPAGVSYVPGSTTMRDGTLVQVPDDSSGTPFPLDEGGLDIGTLPGLRFTIITYDAVIEDPGTFTNLAEFVSPAADPASVDLLVPFRVEGYEVGKTLIGPSGVVSPGQVITFDLTITNTGNVTITNLPLRDTYDQNYLSYRDNSASVAPDNVVAGEITWNDLTSVLGDLPPTTTMQVSLSFDVVDPIPSGVISTTNIAWAEGVQDSVGRTQAIMCGDASVSFTTPTPTLTSTPTSTSTPTPTPTRPKTSTPPSKTVTATPFIVTSTPIATPTPPVLFLPETGVEQSPTLPWWSLALLPGLGLLVGWVVYRQRKR